MTRGPEFDEATASVMIDNARTTTVEGTVSFQKEVCVSSQGTTGWESFYSLISFSGMTKTAVPVSNFVAKSFSSLDNVQAVLAGESADVLHVWIMIDEWNPEARKQVYAIQKTILKQLEGLHFDFYVIDLPHGTRPQEMVSDIPVIFNRAEQDSAPPNCSAQ
jgi:hypothetical protein